MRTILDLHSSGTFAINTMISILSFMDLNFFYMCELCVCVCCIVPGS
jgi:hypothetical protein